MNAMFSSLLLALTAPAHAACTELLPADVERLAEASAQALLTDDSTTHRRDWLDLKEGLPCLRGQLPKDAWASLLVSEAIVRNALGEDWLEPLDTASAIAPDLPGLPQFMRDQYTAAAPPAPKIGRAHV